MKLKLWPVALGAITLAISLPVLARAESPGSGAMGAAKGSAASSLAPVAQFENVPVGIAISRDGRVFLAFSRAIDETEPYSVAELKDGKPVAFPEGLKQDNGQPANDRLLSVQALTVDARNRLWILDTAKVGQSPIQPGAPKLIAVDLGTNRVVQTISFPADVAGATAFLNDVRIDLTKGSQGTAFLTDSSFEGPNGLIVVDLASGKSARRLNDHPSTKPVPGLVAKVEGQPLILKEGPSAGQPFKVGADGIALDADGHHLWYAPTTSHRLYRVSSDALADLSKSDADVAKTVEDHGDKGFGSDGLLGDAQGRLYITDYEENAIVRRNADGKMEDIVQDARLLWPDSMALTSGGDLYFTTTQIERSKRLQGQDKRTRPFTLWKVHTDSRPLMLGSTTPRQARTP